MYSRPTIAKPSGKPAPAGYSILGPVVFLCGACVMVLELVGSRLMAPYLGTSVFIWTSLIGVILAFLSLGYWMGGKLADRRPQMRVLARILLLAGLSVAALAILGDRVLYVVQGAIVDVRIGAVVATTVLFGVPSALLGAVSPYAVRLKLAHVEEAGSTAGSLYALSTVGSIVGTFLAGFFLLSYFSHRTILFIVSVVLVILSPVTWRAGRAWPAAAVSLAVVAVLARTTPFVQAVMGPGFVDVHTVYQRGWIYEGYMGEHPVRVLQLNDAGESAMFLDSDELALDYTRYFRLGGHFCPDLRRGLMLGGGAFSFAKDFLSTYTNASLDVVEIDPGLQQIATKLFRLRPNPRLHVFNEDARVYLNRTHARYDAVYVDVYNSFAIPFQVATREAMEKISGCLADDGVVLANVISAAEGPRGQVLRAMVATMESVFPQVLVFAVDSLEDGTKRQNFILAGFKTDRPRLMTSDRPDVNGCLGRLWTKPIARDVAPLTDAYAPLERYTAAMVVRQPEGQHSYLHKRMAAMGR